MEGDTMRRELSAPAPAPAPASPSVLTPSRSLLWLALGSLALLAVSLLMQLLDARQVLGASTWLKPAKFGASTAITVGTLALLLRWMQPLTRGVRRAVAISVWLLALELVIITVQAARGVPSHFNAATPLDMALFSVMGIAISVVWAAFAYLAWRAFRHRFADPALGWGIRLGLVALVLGSGLGFIMPRPTAAQLESLSAGRPTPAIGAHAVGVPDGGPGLPLTRWSTEGGDLRIPHFVGMHGLQLVPLMGWAFSRRRRAAVRVEAQAAPPPEPHRGGFKGPSQGPFYGVNDVGVITFKDGQQVIAAVFVEDAGGPPEPKERVIAAVARLVWDRHAPGP
jgi:hypothetical protein